MPVETPKVEITWFTRSTFLLVSLHTGTPGIGSPGRFIVGAVGVIGKPGEGNPGKPTLGTPGRPTFGKPGKVVPTAIVSRCEQY